MFGEIDNPVRLTYDEVLQLPTRELVCDLHCVTRWSLLNTKWKGIPTSEIVRRFPPRPEARFVMVHADVDYTTNLPLKYLLAEDAILAFQYADKELSVEHGWPLRLLVPRLYLWKSAKWVRGFEFMTDNKPGFWERHGYHILGDPWKEQRFQE